MTFSRLAGAGFCALTLALGLALSAPAARAQDDTSTSPRPGYGMMRGGGQGPGQGMGPGMMGQGMMGSGMAGQGYGRGMMGGGGMGGCGMMGNSASGDYDTYLDGRIAFLKAELKITEDEEPAWNEYADAMRTNSQTMVSMRGTMMQMFRNSGQNRSVVDLLNFRIEAMKARLETLQELKPATEKLYNALSDEQKKKADEILPVMGCM
ncbi:Spy/CpxP family protein refolding chaperone [Parvibaculum sp.]|uniref:Spy/CpxP family protein refolding chaperone n=1 Tax=Parvibaculum sp. TaxID=2024848 RepID=UPI000C904AF1|nr:Spy/CpxP family protein refolding chaperone [Parvibaculum sp.]MAB12606.1 hypothetical protein [Parvibaculum sp.]